MAAESGEHALAEQITEQYLIHKFQKGHKQYRVLPRVTDREAFIAVVRQKVEKEHQKFGVFKAQRFFRRRIEELVAETSVEQL